ADGVHFFFVVYLQGEEVHALPGRGRHADRDHYGGFAAADNAGAVCLFGVLADFDYDVAAAYGHCKLFKVHFSFSLSVLAPAAPAADNIKLKNGRAKSMMRPSVPKLLS